MTYRSRTGEVVEFSRNAPQATDDLATDRSAPQDGGAPRTQGPHVAKSSREATRLGLDAGLTRPTAAVFGYLCFWHPKASYRHDGHLWTYATRQVLERETSYSGRTLDRALNELVGLGLIYRKAHSLYGAYRRTTLMRLTAAGLALLTDARQPPATTGRNHRRDVAMSGDSMTPLEPPPRRERYRQDGALSSSVPLQVSLKEHSSSQNKQDRRSSEVSQEGDRVSVGGSPLVSLVNRLLLESRLPQWNVDGWANKQAAKLQAKLTGTGMDDKEFSTLFVEAMKDWSSILELMPRAYREYPDNQHRPSAMCLADRWQDIAAYVLQHREWARERELEQYGPPYSEEDVQLALAHLMEGHDAKTPDFPRGWRVWLAAYELARQDRTFNDDYEVKVRSFMNPEGPKDCLFKNGEWL